MVNEKAWKRKFDKAMKALQELAQDVRKEHPRAYILARPGTIELWSSADQDWTDGPYENQLVPNERAKLLASSGRLLSQCVDCSVF